MTLPSFKSLGARRREHKHEKEAQGEVGGALPEQTSDRTLSPPKTSTSNVDLKRATRTRKHAVVASAVLFFVAVVFLILVNIGQVAIKPVLETTWFFQLDLTDIYPTAFGSTDLVFVNSIARSLGLHDFYRVGLWNFCEGYNNEGTTYCSPPTRLYWFNPVEILIDELLAGATITLPAQITDILNLIMIASHLMFGFFVTGCTMCFVSIFLVPLTIYSRWWSLPVAIFTSIAALLTTAGTAIATAMFLTFRIVITSQDMLNIKAAVGRQMFAFMWIAATCAMVASLIHLCLACCCASRRDVKTGRKRGSGRAYGAAAVNEKSKTRRMGFFRRKTAGEVV